jgi:thiol-disulfide isomerase/thioredoxin
VKYLSAVIAALLISASAIAQTVQRAEPPDSLGFDKAKREILVSDYRGKVVVVTFWASWCVYCLKELPVLENVQRKVGADRIAVVAINTDKDLADYRAISRRMKDFELTMTVDRGIEKIARKYGVTVLPHMVMIDRAGKVAYTHVGYSRESLPALVDEINGLLDETPAVAAAPSN